MAGTLLRAVANPRRCAILGLIWDEERSAGEIADRFEVSWPAISQHLGILRDAGAVTERRDGRRRLYRAHHRALAPLGDIIRTMWMTDLETLRLLAEAEARADRR